jgi:HK97 family phage prohead protease
MYFKNSIRTEKTLFLEHKHVSDINLKNINQDGCFCGYASVFNVVDQQGDLIEFGAFGISMDNPGNVKLLWQHVATEPIGVIDQLEEDSHGLYIKARLLLDIPKGREAYSLIKSGAINGLSIGYMLDEWDVGKNGIRIIKSLSLVEVSVVTFPANTAASITNIKGISDLAELNRAIEKAIESFKSRCCVA